MPIYSLPITNFAIEMQQPLRIDGFQDIVIIFTRVAEKDLLLTFMHYETK